MFRINYIPNSHSITIFKRPYFLHRPLYRSGRCITILPGTRIVLSGTCLSVVLSVSWVSGVLVVILPAISVSFRGKMWSWVRREIKAAFALLPALFTLPLAYGRKVAILIVS